MAAAEDELDEILNGIISGQDSFDPSNVQPQTEPQNQQASNTVDTNLGIDEEITVVKKRDPIPKLDENRLLSDAGIPRLQRISKDRIRFKGKGHEYGDIARMLNMYQLWLDDLYPRAKFADGLAMIENLGHKKRIQYMRKEWIDEGKPKRAAESESEDDVAAVPADAVEQSIEQMEGLQTDSTGENQAPKKQEAVETLRQTKDGDAARAPSNEDPDEDELDALLAETSATNSLMTPASHPPKMASTEEDMFADDMEAMAEMEGLW